MHAYTGVVLRKLLFVKDMLQLIDEYMFADLK